MVRTATIQALRSLPIRQRLITALDVPDARQAVELAERLGDAGAVVKVGLELFTAAGPAVVERLAAAGKSVFLDLKLHDIPNTVAGAVRAAARLPGVVMLTLHAAGGEAMLAAAVEAAGAVPRPPALLAVTVLTSLDDAAWGRICPGHRDTAAAVAALAADALAAGCDGIVCSPAEIASLRRELGGDFLSVTPGVRPRGAAAEDQRRIATPAAAMAAGADFLVVGRPITRAPDPGAAIAALSKELPA